MPFEVRKSPKDRCATLPAKLHEFSHRRGKPWSHGRRDELGFVEHEDEQHNLAVGQPRQMDAFA
jgi:hypothetical protein